MNQIEFIKNYNESDKHNIEFKSNEKEGDEWADINANFRDEISDLIFKEKVKAPDLLIKDMFRAEAVFSREIWGSSKYVSALGALLLKQTKEKYIEDYFLGKEESFDTQCAVSLGDIGQEILKEIVTNLKQNSIQLTQGDFEVADIIEYIESYIKEHYEK